MEFNSEGGVFVVDVRSAGQEWGVEVPWDVASEGWRKDNGEASPNRDQLKAWLTHHEGRFAAMIVARVDPDAGPPLEPDDPRVLAGQTLRHI